MARLITGTSNNTKSRFHPSSEYNRRWTALSTLYTIKANTRKSKATDVVSRENSHSCLGLNFVSTERICPSIPWKEIVKVPNTSLVPDGV